MKIQVDERIKRRKYKGTKEGMKGQRQANNAVIVRNPHATLGAGSATWQPKRSGARRSQSLTINAFILTCHPYGILLTDNIFSTDISSLRDFLSATTENTDKGRISSEWGVVGWGLVPLLLRVRVKPAMTALISRFRASA
jgi:hypothetical protein